MAEFLQTIPGALLLLVIGFVGLVKGADFFVEGASNVAKRLHIPSLIIGLTIVAMGTSLPETAVSISASLSGTNSLAISNVSGSNIFNLMVVVGLCAIMQTIAVDKDTIKRDIPLSLLAAVLMMVFAYTGNTLGRTEGLVLLLIFAGYIILMIKSALKARRGRLDSEEPTVEVSQSVLLSVLCIVGGAAAIAIGGDWVVDASTTLALKLGMTETLVGLTIVAVGTSLPELVTSIVAARKNEVEMALGNAIGSNIFNILMVVGFAGLISPISLAQTITNNLIDITVIMVFTIAVWLMVFKDKKLTRSKGILMVLAYVAYMAYIILRDM